MVEPLQVDAAGSKVAQKAAMKVAKDVIKDEAVNMSFNMVMNYKYTPKADREKIKEPDKGFTMVCMPRHIKNDVCDRPVQVKTGLYSYEKKAIEEKVEVILDKKTGNSGWLKYINWFVPVWIAGTAWTVTELLLDGDISSFFSDTAYQALVDLGFIKPLEKQGLDTDVPKPITDPIGDDRYEDTPVEPNYSFLGSENNHIARLPVGITIVNDDNAPNFTVTNSGGVSKIAFTFESDRPYYFHGDNAFHLGYVHVYFTTMTSSKGKKLYWFGAAKQSSPGVNYSRHGFANDASVDLMNENIYLNRPKSHGLNDDEFNHLMNISKELFFDDLIIGIPEPMPETTPEELPVLKPNETIIVPSPSSVPVKDTSTGKTVKPKEGSTPDDITWIDVDGNEVPEENIEVGEIEIEINEDGGTQIVKNPDPEGIPNMKEQPTPALPDTPQEPGTDDPEFPEGPSCTDKLNKPDFKPVGDAFTNAFPFSIPWDIKDYIDNAFGAIGDKRPSFDLTFLGDGVVLEIPEYFDSWVSFAKSFTIIVFDIALLFMFYRFMKGGND